MKAVLCCVLVFLIWKDSDANDQTEWTWGRGGRGRWGTSQRSRPLQPAYKTRIFPVSKTRATTSTTTSTTSTTTTTTTTTTTAAPPPAEPAPAPERPASRRREKDSLYEHKNAALLPTDQCGKQPAHRIVNGDEAGLNQFPWMAFLLYQGDYRCGGSLISSRYVLTAAHCKPDPKEYKDAELVGVRLGEHDLTTDRDCDGDGCTTSVDVPVEELITHPDYKEKVRSFDVMLIRLAQSVQFRDNILPICLPMNERAAQVDDNEYFLVAGWGATNQSNNRDKFADVKQIVEVMHMGPRECKSKWSLRVKFIICAGGLEDEKDSCVGDSGGPLVTTRVVNGVERYMSLGVLSKGHRICGTPGYPGLYVKTFPKMQWILDTMRP